MRPTLHLSLLAFLLLQLHSHANADCEPATCGNLTLRYPFWFGDSKLQTPSPCGHPAFEIWCAERSVASLRFTSFHVLDIDYANNSLIVSNTGVAAAGVCSTYFNMSINLSVGPFTIGHRNRALCFLHNCNGTAPSGPGYVNATSNCSAPIYAYLGGTYHWGKPPPEIAPGGCTYSYLPVLMQEAEITITAANYSRLLKDGFVLEWEMASVGDCDACAATGGQCRYNKSMMAAFWCLCPGGGRAELACAGESLSLTY
ncbi:hypothetical protein HU200_031322 [Digitaria exilis]|uniref:Uncharacterized protein n=1 Tax=Digitaria exilis TaxID=1010633 RepID=A0A835ERN3_9POAL|nr:hypothetical protein HU200_031322 [Digitaria exilis]CAB3476362.1 unnamed protein product [Digitaria exilis]